MKKWKKAHPEAMAIAQKKYWAKNREKLIAKRAKFRKRHPHYDAQYLRKVRKEALKHYGSKCRCCGEKNYEFLCFDHIKGGGSKHRKELNAYGSKFLFWLRRNNYPKGFRVMCHNCNMARGLYGYCPHKRRKTQ